MHTSWGTQPRRLISSNNTSWLQQHNLHSTNVHSLYHHACSLVLHSSIVMAAASQPTSHQQHIVTCSASSSPRRSRRRQYAKQHPGVWHNREQPKDGDGGGNTTAQPLAEQPTSPHDHHTHAGAHLPHTAAPLLGSAARPLQAKAGTGGSTEGDVVHQRDAAHGGIRQIPGNDMDGDVGGVSGVHNEGGSTQQQGSWELVQVATRGTSMQYEYNTKACVMWFLLYTSCGLLYTMHVYTP